MSQFNLPELSEEFPLPILTKSMNLISEKEETKEKGYFKKEMYASRRRSTSLSNDSVVSYVSSALKEEIKKQE